MWKALFFSVTHGKACYVGKAFSLKGAAIFKDKFYVSDIDHLVEIDKMRIEHKRSDLVCYCFNYSASDIREDVLKHGRSLIMERIKEEKKKGGCTCGLSNPKGR